MKKIALSFILVLITFVIFANHLGTAIPVLKEGQLDPAYPGVYIEKTNDSHRHIFLSGGNYNRGFEFGRYTKDVLFMEEDLMVSKLDMFIGNEFIQKTFFTMLMLWFHDVDQYIDRDALEEMQGVGYWSPKKFDNLASSFTRQIAYHGMHEVGQMFVDEDRVDMGCFVSAVKSESGHWVIGRNFDFDIDGLFDREKILKWVYPESGNPFLSVIWPGMVGVVSGVNANGLYASINAAGSDDYKRVGTPTTIVVRNVLQKANTLEEAIGIIKNSQLFITEIFVLADKGTNRIAIVERSPKRTAVRLLTKPDVVSNHLEGDIWEDDKTNIKRKIELTSELRKKRGLELISEGVYKDPVAKTAEIMRDKSLFGGHATHPGNRGAIDSYIASQSLIYDLEKGIFYVNLGPGTTGKYVGYDVPQSLKTRTPVIVNTLPRLGPTNAEYEEWQKSIQEVTKGKKELKKNNCTKVSEILTLLTRKGFVHYEKNRLEGDYATECLKDTKEARRSYKAALDFYPPYEKQRKYLEEKLK